MSFTSAKHSAALCPRPRHHISCSILQTEPIAMEAASNLLSSVVLKSLCKPFDKARSRRQDAITATAAAADILVTTGYPPCGFPCR